MQHHAKPQREKIEAWCDLCKQYFGVSELLAWIENRAADWEMHGGWAYARGKECRRFDITTFHWNSTRFKSPNEMVGSAAHTPFHTRLCKIYIISLCKIQSYMKWKYRSEMYISQMCRLIIYLIRLHSPHTHEPINLLTLLFMRFHSHGI